MPNSDIEALAEALRRYSEFEDPEPNDLYSTLNPLVSMLAMKFLL